MPKAATKSKSTNKSTKTSTKEVVGEVAVEESVVQQKSAKQQGNLESEFSGFRDSLSSVRDTLAKRIDADRQLRNDVKKIQKDFNRIAREVGKKHKKRNTDPNKKRAPSGITRPGPISKELAKFLGVDPKTELARTEVNRKICEYVKVNDLQNPKTEKFSILNILSNEETKKLLEKKIKLLHSTNIFNLKNYI